MPAHALSPAASLAKKILNIMAEIGELKKDKKNDHFNYQFASHEMILNSVRPLMIKHGVAVFPSQKSCSEIMCKTAKGADQIITKVETSFEIVDAETGETRTVSFFGYGADSGDKGVYKASTGAHKYFFTETFQIATSDDPEFEKNQRAARETYSGRAQYSYPKPPAQPPVTQTNGATSPPKSAPATVVTAAPANAVLVNAAPAIAALANAAPAAAATAQPTTSSRTPQQQISGYVDDVKQINPKVGDKFYKVIDTEGASYATWRESTAKMAKELKERGVPVVFAVRFEPKGPVLDGIRPA